MAGSRSLFNCDWMDKTLNPDFSSWIKPVPSNRFQAHCTVCHKNFELSNMSRSAVVSHLKSASHVRKIGTNNSCNTICSFLSVTGMSLSQQQATSSATLLQPVDEERSSNQSHIPSTSFVNAAANVPVGVKVVTKICDTDKMGSFVVKQSVK